MKQFENIYMDSPFGNVTDDYKEKNAISKNSADIENLKTNKMDNLTANQKFSQYDSEISQNQIDIELLKTEVSGNSTSLSSLKTEADSKSIVADSSTNGNIVINGVDTKVYDDSVISSQLAETTSQLNEKASQSYVDNKFGNMGNTKTFKGSCLFSNLPSSGMSVDDYWYVTDKTTNYCYNGTAWVDIGNNLNIGNGSITDDLLSPTGFLTDLYDIRISTNVINPKAIIQNTAIYSWNLSAQTVTNCTYTSSGQLTTEAIPVTEGQIYKEVQKNNSIPNFAFSVMYFNSSGAYVEYDSSVKTTTVPAGATQMRLNFVNLANTPDAIMLVSSIDESPVYAAYGYNKTLKPIAVPDNSIIANNLNTTLRSNLGTFVPVSITIQNGYYDKWNTTLNSNSNYKSIYAACTPGEIYNCDVNATTTSMAMVYFYDVNNARIGNVGEGAIATYSAVEFIVPNGAAYLSLTSSNSTPVLRKYSIYNINNITIATNQWHGKKIVWIGTSVPFGQYSTKSYAQEASNKLGFTLINASVPGEAIHTNVNGSMLTYGSTCLSISEYASQGTTIASSPIDYVPGGSYNNYYRTWENIFTSANADADLWVFDVVPNNNNFDTTDWDAFDKTNWKYTDDSTFDSHRTTFLGALLFLMDKMYDLNANARMAFVLGSTFGYSSGQTALNAINSYWNIPTIDIWKKANISPKSLLQIHGTASHPSTFGHEILGNIITNELLLVS